MHTTHISTPIVDTLKQCLFNIAFRVGKKIRLKKTQTEIHALLDIYALNAESGRNSDDILMRNLESTQNFFRCSRALAASYYYVVVNNLYTLSSSTAAERQLYIDFEPEFSAKNWRKK